MRYHRYDQVEMTKFAIPRASTKDQEYNYFVTCEADPNLPEKEGQKKLLKCVEQHWPGLIAKSKVVKEVSTNGYHHYHCIVKLKKPQRWKRLCDKIVKTMKYEKPGGKGISVWFGKGRRGDSDTYGDWDKYVSRKSGKKKVQATEDHIEWTEPQCERKWKCPEGKCRCNMFDDM